MTTRRRVVTACRASTGALIAILLLGSCRQLADIEAVESCEDSGIGAGVCGACMRSSCCDAWVACRAALDCAPLAECLAPCGDNAACATECRQLHPLGLNEAFAVLAGCKARSCAEACGLSCGGYVYPDEGCAKCGAKCCDEERACGTSPECLALAFCQLRCSVADCRGDCQRLHPAGLELERDFAACLTKECRTECSGPPDPWACSGAQPLAMPALKLTVKVNDPDFADPKYSEPLQGVAVQLCPQNGVSCNDAKATDSDGEVELDVPAGFDGYLLLERQGFVRWIQRLQPLPIDETGKRLLPVGMVTWEEGEEFLAYAGGSAKQGHGHLFARAFDCNGDIAAGISFDLETLDGHPATQTPPYYGQWAQLSTTMTDGMGFGGLLNLAPGTYVLRYVRRETDECVHETVVRIDADSITAAGQHVARGCGVPRK